jgi:hypothetical protein
MGTPARALLRPTLCFGLLTAACAPSALGSSVYDTFSGTFLGATSGTLPPGITSGDTITGYFEYGLGTTLKAASGGNSYTEVYSITETASAIASGTQQLSFTIENKNPYPDENFNDLYSVPNGANTSNFTVTIIDNINSKGAIVAGATMEIAGATGFGATVTLTLTSTTYTGLALPSTMNAVANFLEAGSTQTLSYDAPFDFSTSVVVPLSGLEAPGELTIPEPSSVILGVIATVTVATGFSIVRRKRKVA